MSKIKYPLKLKKLPKEVEKAWFYGGKNKSIHIVFKPQEHILLLNNEFSFKHTTKMPQLNINI